MSTINDGGPAFPVTASTGDPRDGVYCRDGMSLRDWFAGQENLTEWDNLSNGPSNALCETLAGPKPSHGWGFKTEDELVAMLQWEATWRARIKYIRADAMLKARGK